MIFAYTFEKVLTNRKTQTRRLIKTGQRLIVPDNPAENVSVQAANGRKLYEVGKSYAVQPGRGKHAVGRIKITDLSSERVIDISDADARAEGFDSREDYWRIWREIHGAKADLHARVWVIKFVLNEKFAP